MFLTPCEENGYQGCERQLSVIKEGGRLTVKLFTE